MKKRLLFLFLVLSALSVFPQNSEDVLPLPDSLVGRLKEHRKTDLARAEALKAAIMFYADENRILEAQPYIYELASFSNVLNDHYWEVLSDFFIIVCELNNYNYSKSLEKLNDVLNRVETLRLTDRTRLLTARIYLTKSAYFNNMNMLPESYDAIQQGLKILDDSDSKVKSRLMNNLGVIYAAMQNYDEALKIFIEARYGEKKVEYYNNIVSMYYETKCYDSALAFVDSALMLSTSLYDSLWNKHLRGMVLFGSGELDKAELCYEECLKRAQICTDANLNAFIYLNSASIAGKRGDFQKAKFLNNEAFNCSNKLQNDNTKLNCIKQKALILRNMGDFESSLTCMLEYDSLSEVLLLHQNKDRVNEIIQQQEIREIEQQYELRRQASQHRQLIIILLSACFVAIALLIAVIIWLNRRRLQIELELRNREITAKSMGKMQSNEMLNDVIEKLSAMEEHPEKNVLPGAIRDLKTLVDADSKKDFDLHFVQMHPDFYQKLLADFPKLTQNELRLCAFIKSNLSMKEIAAINGISADSVKTARKRLRKSLNLTGEDTSLLEFLSKY